MIHDVGNCLIATIDDAISHFEYGISHDIFCEPVTTYAKMAVEALEKLKNEKQEGQDSVNGGIKYYESRIRQCDGAMFCPICGGRLKL